LEWNQTPDLKGFLGLILSKEIKVESLLDQDPAITVTDDRPFNEYYFLRHHFPGLFRY